MNSDATCLCATKSLQVDWNQTKYTNAGRKTLERQGEKAKKQRQKVAVAGVFFSVFFHFRPTAHCKKKEFCGRKSEPSVSSSSSAFPLWCAWNVSLHHLIEKYMNASWKRCLDMLFSNVKLLSDGHVSITVALEGPVLRLDRSEHSKTHSYITLSVLIIIHSTYTYCQGAQSSNKRDNQKIGTYLYVLYICICVCVYFILFLRMQTFVVKLRFCKIMVFKETIDFCKVTTFWHNISI